MEQLSATTTGYMMTAQEVSLQEAEEGTMEQQRFRGLQSWEIMEEQAKSGGLYSGLIDLDNLMDKGANKSCPQSKQTMASMQQKGGAQPHPSSSTAQQQPYYNISSSMGWGQSMGMQNPGMGMQNPGMGMQNPGMGYGMMPMYPMYGQYGMQPGMIGTGYGMNPE